MDTKLPPATIGLLNCLRMLAEEAAQLQLTQTVAAVRGAVETCLRETAVASRLH